MLFKRPANILSIVNDGDMMAIAESLTLDQPVAYPVFECVKVWCRLDSNNAIVFARDKNDVILGGVSHEEIVSRFKNDEVKNESFSILTDVSKCLPEVWPFMPGSNSWILIEMLSPVFSRKVGENRRTVILRESSRLSYNKGPVTSPSSEKVFQRMNKDFSYNETVFTGRQSSFLRSSSGDGVLTEIKERLNNLSLESVAGEISQFVFEHNPQLFSEFGYPLEYQTENTRRIIGVDVDVCGKLIRVSNKILQEEKIRKGSTFDSLISPIWRK